MDCSFYVEDYTLYLLSFKFWGDFIVYGIIPMFLLYNLFWYSPAQGQQMKFSSVANSGAVFDCLLSMSNNE